MSSARTFSLAFLKKEEIQTSVFCYYFDWQKADFQFDPGQYIQMTLPHAGPDERGTSRFFTITSSPTEEYLMIVSRKGKSSFKKALFDLKKGTQVQCFGPIGTFTLPES